MKDREKFIEAVEKATEAYFVSLSESYQLKTGDIDPAALQAFTTVAEGVGRAYIEWNQESDDDR